MAAWRRERGIWRRTKNPPSERHLRGAFMLLTSLPMMWYVAFHSSWTLWLSFTFSAFLAVSYATFFSKPLVFILIFIGLLVGGIAREVLFEAKDTAVAGDLVGALIVLGVGLYVMWWSNELKTGNLPSESKSPGSHKRPERPDQ